MRTLLERFSFKKKRRALSDARNRQTRLHALYRLELALTSTLNLRGRLKILLEHTTAQMQADIGAVFLIEPISNDLVVIAQRGAKNYELADGFRLKVGEGAAGWIVQHNQPLAIPDVREEPRWKRADWEENENIVSYLGVPLVVDGQAIGALDVSTRMRRIFSEEDIEFFETLAGRAAVFIKNAQMVEELRLYKNALNSAADAITITDLKGRILDVNPSFERLTGYSRAESLGRNMSIVKSQHTTLDYYQKMWKEILSNGHWMGELINRRKNGEEWRSWNTISTVRDENGKPIAYVGVNRDITAIRQTETALSRRVKELEFLHRSALTMTATPNLDTALEQVLNLMSQEFGYPYLAIGLMDQESGRIC
ncbi:MAG: PAS domain S-box protein, partial [Chloroflexota bacterium]